MISRLKMALAMGLALVISIDECWAIGFVGAGPRPRPQLNDISGGHGGLPLQSNEYFGSQACLFGRQALAGAALSFVVPKVRGFFLKAPSIGGLLSIRRRLPDPLAPHIPKELLDRYPRYAGLFAALASTVLDSHTLLKTSQEKPESFQRAVEIIDQNRDLFLRTLDILVPDHGEGLSWMANKFKWAFAAFPSLAVSSLHAAGHHADTLIRDHYVHHGSVELGKLFEDHAVTLSLPMDNSGFVDNSRWLKKLAHLGDSHLNISAGKPALAVTFHGDAFLISPNEFLITVPEDLAVIGEKSWRHSWRAWDDHTYALLGFCVKIALAAAILNQQKPGVRKAVTHSARRGRRFPFWRLNKARVAA